jgi:hypothetical protein
MSFVKRNPFRVNNYESLKVAAQEIATKVLTNQTIEKIQNYSAKRVDKLTNTTIDEWDAEDIAFLLIILFIVVVVIICFFLKTKKTQLPTCSINSLRSAFYENQAAMSNTRMWQIISCAGNVANFKQEPDENVRTGEQIKRSEIEDTESEVYIQASAFPSVTMPSESVSTTESDESVTTMKKFEPITTTTTRQIYDRACKMTQNKQASNPEPLISL